MNIPFDQAYDLVNGIEVEGWRFVAEQDLGWRGSLKQCLIVVEDLESPFNNLCGFVVVKSPGPTSSAIRFVEGFDFDGAWYSVPIARVYARTVYEVYE